MEAIKSLHQQLDDDDNGNIDLTESDDVSSFFKIVKSAFLQNDIFLYLSFYVKSSNMIPVMKKDIKHFITMMIHRFLLKNYGKHG